jgi:hypothetical protein
MGVSAVELLRVLTLLIAAHGVYALSAIFIFYQQRRSVTDLAKATDPTDRRLFRRVYVSVVAATYVLVLLTTGVWIYGNFVHRPVSIVKGLSPA